VTFHPRETETEEGEVAESKRRGEDAVEHLDEELDDAVRDDALDDQDIDDELDSDVDDELDDRLDDEEEDEDDAPVRSRRNGKVPAKATKGVSKKPDPKAKAKVDAQDRVGIFGRVIRFIREVVSELGKVIRPTRKELLTYTSVVIVFVAVIVAIVAGLDSGFAWLVLHIFGGKK
jgi:preprotein translocase subunit SecE